MLGDGAAWERLADSVAVEVRRHGAPAKAAPPEPAEAAAPATKVVVGEATPPQTAMLSQAALPAPPLLAQGIAGLHVPASTIVHIDNRNYTRKNYNHVGNTSIVFM